MRVLSAFVVLLLTIFAVVAMTSVSAAAAASGPLKTLKKPLENFVASSENPAPPASCHSSESGKGGFDCYPQRPKDGNIPVYTQPPVFVKKVQGGKLYLAGSGNDTINVVHLWAKNDNLYDMGFALGQLLPKEVDSMWNTIEPWLVKLLEGAVKWLPPKIAETLIKYGGPAAIDLVYDLCEPYIPKRYIQEWEGMAAGANCSIEQIKRVAMFPQVSKAACTAFSSIGPGSLDGTCNQLRALDFDPTSMVADFSSLIIYHYTTKPIFANFGYLSLTGCLTCASYDPKTGSSIFGGEKDWGNHYKPGLLRGYGGIPWMMLFREMMEFSSLAEIDSYIQNHTTLNPDSDNVAIHLVFTQAFTNSKNNAGANVGWEIGYNYSKKFDWMSQGNSSKHPAHPGLIYWTKNSDPHTMCPADLINSQYGKITNEWMANYYSPNDMTGDTQVTAFDASGLNAYVANSRKSGSSGPLCAYYRQRTYFDMKALYDETEN